MVLGNFAVQDERSSATRSVREPGGSNVAEQIVLSGLSAGWEAEIDDRNRTTGAQYLRREESIQRSNGRLTNAIETIPT